MEKVYYFISNSDNKIHKTSEFSNLRITEQISYVEIEILSEDGSVLDTVVGYETLGDLYESMAGGNELE